MIRIPEWANQSSNYSISINGKKETFPTKKKEINIFLFPVNGKRRRRNLQPADESHY